VNYLLKIRFNNKSNIQAEEQHIEQQFQQMAKVRQGLEELEVEAEERPKL
jgi:hypothetical protein